MHNISAQEYKGRPCEGMLYLCTPYKEEWQEYTIDT